MSSDTPSGGLKYDEAKLRRGVRSVCESASDPRDAQIQEPSVT